MAAWIVIVAAIWVFPHPVRAQVPSYRPFERGDVNGDGGHTLVDALQLLNYLFVGGAEPNCHDAADVNDDEQLGLNDPLWLLNYLFTGGAAPLPPFGSGTCGPDPTLDIVLTCESYDPCAGVTDRDEAGHVLRRAGFGPTPGLMQQVQTQGVDAYLAQQLFPENIDESNNELLNLLLPGLTPTTDPVHLIWLQIVRALYSDRQLQEALTEFWEYHFNTDFFKILQTLNMAQVMGVPLFTPAEAVAEATRWEFEENAVLRTLALGTFGNLLLASATSKTMIVYLDNLNNIVGAPNENYARELVELHTMGVDNGYTQEDIEELARCFTGWSLCNAPPDAATDPNAICFPLDDPNGILAFHFYPNLHDYDAKTIFAGTSYELNIPVRPNGAPEGVFDGLEVIAHLASLPQTAEFVCSKLIQRFVDDDVPPALLAQCINTWLLTGGDMRAIVTLILQSDEFLDPQHRWTKVATPFEYLVGQVRATGALTTGLPLLFGFGGDPLASLVGLDYVPFIYETPEGRSELGFDWLGSTNLLYRINFSNLLAASNADPTISPVTILQDAGVPAEDAGAIADFWLQRLYQNHYSFAERQLVIDFLETDEFGNNSPLDALAVDYEERIRNGLGFMLSAPQAQQQ